MLGGLLSRQAEEEERQRWQRQQRQQQSWKSPPPPPPPTTTTTTTTDHDRFESSASPELTRRGDDDCDRSEGGEYSYDDDDDDDDDEDDDDDDDDEDEDDDEEEDDDAYGASSYRRADENENTHLLGGSSSNRGGGGNGTGGGGEGGGGGGGRRGGRSRRRRRRGRGRRRRNDRDECVDDGTWRTRMSRLWSRVRGAMVALADVDNVWDSPDDDYDAVVAPSMGDRSGPDVGGGGGDRRGLSRVAVDDDHGIPASRIILYDVISPGGGDAMGVTNALGGDEGTSSKKGNNRRAAAIFWFIVLFTSYAFERSTFKLLVDRVGPFRLFSADLILGVHAILTGSGMILGRMMSIRGGGGSRGSGSRGRGGGDGGKRRRDIDEMMDMGALPLADIGLMAVFDTVYLLLGVISGAHVPPVLTVILVQTTIPLTACFTQCVHPDGRCVGRPPSSGDGEISSPGVTSTMPYPTTVPDPAPVKGWGGLSRYHITGTCLMFLAIFIGLIPAVLSLHHIVITEEDAMPDRTAYNTIVFCFAAVPAAMSQLYKEQTLTRLRQPIDRNALNMVLSIFQLLFAIVVSPLAYGLQGMGNGPSWTGLYPSRGMGENFSNGFKCFLGTLDDDTMNNGYPEDADCEWSAALVLLHVLSIIMVGVAIDKLAAATKVMYRGVSMGIIFAVILMFWYQIRDRWCRYGPLVSFFHLTATAVLIVGAEIYHRVSLVDASFETVYPEIADLYDDEE